MDFKPIKHSFNVNFSYGLFFTDRVFQQENPTFRKVVQSADLPKRAKLLFVLDQGMFAAHKSLIKEIETYCKAHNDLLELTECLVLPGGEKVKNDRQYVDTVIQAIETFKICRHSMVVAIGGGALIDLVGYAASIAHRGVRLIRIPTTVLAQNDAAVGVKNGVNVLDKKNFIGSFQPPFAVINDSSFLKTLEQREWIAGVAEAVKVSLIKDAGFFDYIRQHAVKLRERDMDVMQEVIYRCAQLHMEHIALGGDPFERGSSRPLDFGHWSAHKMEYMSDYKLRHGEAVAKGMALDLVYAATLGMITQDTLDEILAVLTEVGFNLSIPFTRKPDIEELLEGIEEFREHLGGKLTITLIEGIGKKRDVHEIDRALMKKSVETLNAKVKLNPTRG